MRDNYKDNQEVNLNYNKYSQVMEIYKNSYTDAVVFLATLNNCRDSISDPEHILELNTIYLPWTNFLNIFYKSGNTFNPSNYNNKYLNVLAFSSQSYNSSQISYKLNIQSEIIKAYVNKYKELEKNIPPNKRIQLTLELSKYQTFVDLYGSTISLSLDNAINELTKSEQIIYTGDLDHVANIIFKIYVVIYSKALKVSIGINFNYNTQMPCYMNINNNSDHPIIKPYCQIEKNIAHHNNADNKNNEEISYITDENCSDLTEEIVNQFVYSDSEDASNKISSTISNDSISLKESLIFTEDGDESDRW